MGLSGLVVGFLWTLAPNNGFLIEQQLAQSRVLPVQWVLPASQRVRVVFHDRADWAMAFYLGESPPASSQDVEVGTTAEKTSAPASPPREARIVLFAPFYLTIDGLTPPRAMAVDVAEYFYNALLQAAVEESAGPVDAEWSRWIEERSLTLMPEVPAEQRRAAYLDAGVAFASHVMSIAHEIDRVAFRATAAGKDPCRGIDVAASLYGLWRRSFDSGDYRGSYSHPPGRRTHSQRGLERVDKERFLREVLAVSWTGEPRQDFAALCKASGAVPS